MMLTHTVTHTYKIMTCTHEKWQLHNRTSEHVFWHSKRVTMWVKKKKKAWSNVCPKINQAPGSAEASESLCEAVGWRGGRHNVCFCACSLKPTARCCCCCCWSTFPHQRSPHTFLLQHRRRKKVGVKWRSEKDAVYSTVHGAHSATTV